MPSVIPFTNNESTENSWSKDAPSGKSYSSSKSTNMNSLARMKRRIAYKLAEQARRNGMTMRKKSRAPKNSRSTYYLKKAAKRRRAKTQRH